MKKKTKNKISKIQNGRIKLSGPSNRNHIWSRWYEWQFKIGCFASTFCCHHDNHQKIICVHWWKTWFFFLYFNFSQLGFRNGFACGIVVWKNCETRLQQANLKEKNANWRGDHNSSYVNNVVCNRARLFEWIFQLKYCCALRLFMRQIEFVLWHFKKTNLNQRDPIHFWWIQDRKNQQIIWQFSWKLCIDITIRICWKKRVDWLFLREEQNKSEIYYVVNFLTTVSIGQLAVREEKVIKASKLSTNTLTIASCKVKKNRK